VDDLHKLSTMDGRTEAYGIFSRSGFLALIDNIRSSQQFHFGNIDGLLSMSKKYLGKPLFCGDLGKDVRLPYRLCWFDWPWTDHDGSTEKTMSTKRACLAIGHVKNRYSMVVMFFAFSPYCKTWVPGPLSYVIRIEEAPVNNNIDLHANTELAHKNGPLLDSLLREDQSDLTVLNIALMLINCKNISTIENKPSGPLNKKRIKLGRQPLFTYHTLTIKPVGKKQESIPKELWSNRIHLQRGHFKTYTEASPLFGNIVGRFWWQPHVRGRNRDGVVMKEYCVKGGARWDS
jgi:hypothetical protein